MPGLERWFNWYEKSLAASIAGVIFVVCLIYVIKGEPDTILNFATRVIIWIELAVVGLHFLLLGINALILDRSAVLWILGALLFAPIGTLVAYVRMRRYVIEELENTVQQSVAPK